jgi:adenosylcobinamide kinase/adenosylcobinamide-phosphate guanylyltransferase
VYWKPPDRKILVTGAARCGKSEWAEALAARSGKNVTYVATAIVDPQDEEWAQRIYRHQQRRPAQWHHIEAIAELANIILQATDTDCLLVDSLGTWVANLLDRQDTDWAEITATLIESLQTTPATVILVSEETGWGVVPAYPSGRLFRDRLGMLSRNIGAISNPVYLVTGGHVLNLSQLGTPLNIGSGELGVGNAHEC